MVTQRCVMPYQIPGLTVRIRRESLDDFLYFELEVSSKAGKQKLVDFLERNFATTTQMFVTKVEYHEGSFVAKCKNEQQNSYTPEVLKVAQKVGKSKLLTRKKVLLDEFLSICLNSLSEEDKVRIPKIGDILIQFYYDERWKIGGRNLPSICL